jgi:hypothetical protein
MLCETVGPREARQRCCRANFLEPEPTSQLEPGFGHPDAELNLRQMLRGAPGYWENRRFPGLSNLRLGKDGEGRLEGGKGGRGD